MEMLEKFRQHLVSNFPFLMKSRFFIAVSGGIDSMVLAHLFQHCGYAFEMLHCNFQLRGEESDGDMKFVMLYGDQHKIPYSITAFPTKEYSEQNKISIQLAARELRYNWFETELNTKQFDYVLTAHHADDNLETFLINLSRGTGLEGLTGIPQQNNRILRPLLPFSREEIENYAAENAIQWREDSSNESDKYVRNKIRHHLVPVLKELNPAFLDSFRKTQEYLMDAQSLVMDAHQNFYKEIASEKEDGSIHFNLDELKKTANFKAYLHQWLKPYGFTAWQDIYDLAEAQTGKKVLSEKFLLLKNRNFLVLSIQSENPENTTYHLEKENQHVNIPLKLSFCNVNDISDMGRNCIFVDEEKIRFPLLLRKWEEGDSFYPFGMNGSKKLSKFFKDEKMSLMEKSETWILSSEEQIVWVIGKRMDDRFKVTNNTTNILKITLQ